MKSCTRCKQDKERSEFSASKKREDGLQRWCRLCVKSYDRERYVNGNRGKEVLRARDLKRRNELLEHAIRYLETHPCVDCGEPDPIVLEFDHVRGTKRDGVMNLTRRGVSFQTFLEEIGKCEVRCCNCHRRQTAARGTHGYKWKRLSLGVG